MQSGQLKDMIVRTYNVSANQAESLMDIMKKISDNYKMSFYKGLSEGYRQGQTVKARKNS